MQKWLKSLFNDSAVYGIGYGISRFLQIIILPIVAKNLSLKEFGFYSNYVIFYTIAGGVFVLGLDGAIARFYFDSEDKNYRIRMFSSGLLFSLLVTIIAIAFLWLFSPRLITVVGVPAAYSQSFKYVLLVIPMLVLNNFFQNWFKWRRQVLFFLINSIGSVFFLLLPLLLVRPFTFYNLFKIIFFAQGVTAVISFFISINYIRPVIDKKLLFAMLKYGFPWMLVFFLGLSRSYLDRFFLNHYLNNDQYGLYNFSVRISTIISLMITAFDMAFMPLAFNIWNNDNAKIFFARLQSIYMLVICAFASLITIISPVLVNLFGGEKYKGSENILPFLLFSAIPLSLIAFSSLGILKEKKSFLNTFSLLVGFLVVLILNFVLTPKYLEYGAVNASLIGHIVIAATGYLFSNKFFKIPFSFKKDTTIFFSFLLISIIVLRFHFVENVYHDVILKSLLLICTVFSIFFLFFPSEYKLSLSFLKNIRYAGIRSNARV